MRREDLDARTDPPSSGGGIAVVVGARPNLPKAAALTAALDAIGLTYTVVHSGQHPARLGSELASQVGVRIDIQLDPDTRGTDGGRLGALMTSLGDVLTADRFRSVIVIGDVNTTLAAAIVSSRQLIQVVHLEAGLRSRDPRDPEEINRTLITRCASEHLAPTGLACTNLLEDGVDPDRIHAVGNTLAGTFLEHAPERQASTVLADYDLTPGFLLFTVHKEPTVADPEFVAGLLRTVAASGPVVFPCHPSLKLRWPHLIDLAQDLEVRVLPPLDYDDLGRLLVESTCVVTDSAGIQEEATVAGVHCLTVGAATARPETCIDGTNRFVGFDLMSCGLALDAVLATPAGSRRPELWDREVGSRLQRTLNSLLGPRQPPVATETGRERADD